MPISIMDDNFPLILFTINSNLEIQTINKTALNFFGKQQQDLPFHLSEYLNKNEQTRMLQAVEVTHSRRQWEGEVSYSYLEEPLGQFKTYWQLITGGENAGHIQIVHTPLQEIKQLQAQVLRLQRLESMGTISGGVVHDLNNIFAMFLMATKLLKPNVSDEKGGVILELLEKGVERGIALMGQMLSFARGEEWATAKETQLAPIIHEVRTLLRLNSLDNIDFELDISNELWPILANPVQIHQVLLNLCVNARDALGDNSVGIIRITAENFAIEPEWVQDFGQVAPGNYVRLIVVDTGKGIASENLEKIFEPFFSTKETGKGSGLGLATVNFIIKAHKGFLCVKSVVGQGTSFEIYLPVFRADE